MACVKGLLENYLNSQEKLFSEENQKKTTYMVAPSTYIAIKHSDET